MVCKNCKQKMMAQKSNNTKEAIYQKAIIEDNVVSTNAHYEASVSLLEGIPGYIDADM